MLPESLRRSLLLASALQALGHNHPFAVRLDRALKSGCPEAFGEAEADVAALSDDERLAVLARFEALCDEFTGQLKAA